MSGFLLDTNVISELTRPKPDPGVATWIADTSEDLLFLSVVTLGEICKGIALQSQPARRAALEAWLESELRGRFGRRILPIDLHIAERWGTLAGHASRRGTPLAVIDGLLAATALHHDLIFVTRNAKDVEATGVRTFNPW